MSLLARFRERWENRRERRLESRLARIQKEKEELEQRRTVREQRREFEEVRALNQRSLYLESLSERLEEYSRQAKKKKEEVDKELRRKFSQVVVNTFTPAVPRFLEYINAYNKVVEAYKQGDTRAVMERYERGAQLCNTTTQEYKETLSIALLYGRFIGKNFPLLQRFDKELLDYDAFAADAARLYTTSKETLEVVAKQLAKKYGMNISTSHLSRVARDYLYQHEGVRYANRREAQRKQEEKSAAANERSSVAINAVVTKGSDASPTAPAAG